MRAEREIHLPGTRLATIPGRRTTAVALSVVLAALVADAFLRARGEFDYDLLRAVQRISFPGDERVFTFFSELTGSSWAITLWAVAIVAFLASRRWLAATLMGMFPIAGGVNMLIRETVGRTRPERAEIPLDWSPERLAAADAANDFVSFPSGHVVGAVLLYGFLFYLAGALRPAPAQIAVRTGCVAVIVLCGVSRLWLGAHWTGDVAAGYALGGLALLGMVTLHRSLAPTMTGIPLVRAAAVPHDDSLAHAHALTSTVLFRGELVTKVYNPGFVPRALYWGAFQAPFGYAHNRLALEAAILRRNLAGRLTEYWFGENKVSEALRIDDIGGRMGLTSRFTVGADPADHHAARAFLSELADRFDAAGLPTWQIDPRQPRAVGNLLETPGGDYKVIDLESGIVSPLASPRAWMRAIRRSLVPFYDDVYFDLTRSYVMQEGAAMRTQMGEAWVSGLQAELDAAEAATAAWHASEPRVWSRAARAFWSGFGIPRIPGWLRAKADAGRLRADEWIERSIQRWEESGRLDAAAAARARESLATPDLQALLPHFGVHLIIGVALRFPVGTIARVSYTGGNLLLATARLLFRRIDRRQWHQAWTIHSPLVIAIAALPAVGTFAYLAAKPIRSNRLIARLAADAVGEKLPFHVYRRTGLRRLVAGPEVRREQ